MNNTHAKKFPVNIVFTMGTKGGVGKSTIVRWLTEYLAFQNVSTYLIDGDDETASLKRFYPQAEMVNVRKLLSLDLLSNRAEEQLARVVIGDFRAGVGEEMLDWFATLPFDLLQPARIHFTGIGVLTNQPDSVAAILKWASRLGNSISYILALNHRDGDPSHYLETAEGKEMMERLKPTLVRIPKLDEAHIAELERLNMSISEVLLSEEPVAFFARAAVRGRLRHFQTSIFEEFEKARSVIVPPEE